MRIAPLRSALLLVCTLLPSLGFALMPPHWNSISPAPGSTLNSREILIEGFTLANARPKITNGEGESVPFSTEVNCAWEGKGDMPGAQQQRCTLKVKLMGALKKGSTLTVKLFRNEATYTVGAVDAAGPPEQALPTPAPPSPPAKPAVPGGK